MCPRVSKSWGNTTSDIYSNKAAYTWFTSPRLPFKSTTRSCLTFLQPYSFLCCDSWGSVMLAQLPNQMSKQRFPLRQDDSSSSLPLLIETLVTHAHWEMSDSCCCYTGFKVCIFSGEQRAICGNSYDVEKISVKSKPWMWTQMQTTEAKIPNWPLMKDGNWLCRYIHIPEALSIKSDLKTTWMYSIGTLMKNLCHIEQMNKWKCFRVQQARTTCGLKMPTADFLLTD